MQNRNIVLVHGLHDNVTNWDEVDDQLVERGFNVRRFGYPRRWAISYYLPWIRKNDGLRLANFVNDGDHILAHSNGGNLVQAAIQYSWLEKPEDGVRFDNVFMFSAAATSDKMEYPKGSLRKCYVIYNPRDNALKLGALLPFHCFGSLGLLGFIRTPSNAKDRRFQNIQAYFSSGWFKPNHSFYWAERLTKWMNFIDEKTS